MPLGKLNWIGNRLNWEVSDEDAKGVRTKRVVVIQCGKRWYEKLEPLSRAKVQDFITAWGSEVSPEINIPDLGALVLVVRYHDGPAHTVTGPYRIVE